MLSLAIHHSCMHLAYHELKSCNLVVSLLTRVIVTDAEVQRGKGRVPVADYSLTAQALPDYAEVSSHTAMHAAATHFPASSSSQPQTEEEEQAVPDYAEVSPQTAMHAAATQPPSSSSSRSCAEEEELSDQVEDGGHCQNAGLPSSCLSDSASSQQSHGSSWSSSSEHARHQDRRQSGAAASTTSANGSKQSSHNGSKTVKAREGRGVYSFCMCPGGQIVPTTTNPEELCINGMSFRCAHPAPLVPRGRREVADFLPNEQ